MIEETLGVTGTILQKPPPTAAEKVESGRKDRDKKEEVQAAAKPTQKDTAPAEELLDKIKELTENGQYSIRFENDQKYDSFVVEVVNRKTNEVIRQVPSEDILGLQKHLAEFQGNFVDTIT